MTDPELQPAELNSPREFEWITYEKFGEEFFAKAVTTERIAAAVADMAGRGIKIGPFTIGPGGLAGAVAEGSVGEPTVTRRADDSISFDLVVPVSLELIVRLGGSKARVEVGVEISLVLAARAADPMLIVIDVPAITHNDVKWVVRAEALGAAWEWMLDPIGTVIRREVASRFNAILSDPASVKGRVFDIAAMMDERRQVRPAGPNFAWISYAEFGSQFFRYAVTPERILHALGGLNGRKIDIGPMRTGPKNIAEVTANGHVGEPKISPRAGDLVMYDLVIPAAMTLVIAIPKQHTYQAEIDINLTLTARAAEPLLIVIDVPRVRSDDIAVELESKGFSAAVIGLIGGVKSQIRHEVAKVVNSELADPVDRIVDVAGRIIATV